MDDFTRSIDELRQRMEALEQENRTLWESLGREDGSRGLSRRQLLAGTAGVAGALAGAGLMAHSGTASAAAPAAPSGQRPLALAPTALNFYVTMVGMRSGPIKGGVTLKGHENTIKGLKFDYTLIAPRDAATGQPTGKRQHYPIVFVKEWDRASPVLLNVIVTNETLKSVTFEFWRTSTLGMEQKFYTIQLINASISSYHHYIGKADEVDELSAPQLEDIGLVYQKLITTYTDGGITAEDDWLNLG